MLQQLKQAEERLAEHIGTLGQLRRACTSEVHVDVYNVLIETAFEALYLTQWKMKNITATQPATQPTQVFPSYGAAVRGYKKGDC